MKITYTLDSDDIIDIVRKYFNVPTAMISFEPIITEVDEEDNITDCDIEVVVSYEKEI